LNYSKTQSDLNKFNLTSKTPTFNDHTPNYNVISNKEFPLSSTNLSKNLPSNNLKKHNYNVVKNSKTLSTEKSNSEIKASDKLINPVNQYNFNTSWKPSQLTGNNNEKNKLGKIGLAPNSTNSVKVNSIYSIYNNNNKKQELNGNKIPQKLNEIQIENNNYNINVNLNLIAPKSINSGLLMKSFTNNNNISSTSTINKNNKDFISYNKKK